MKLNRRLFLGSSAAAAGALAAPMVLAQGKPRVVVVGGGAGGATAARYIAKDSSVTLTVTSHQHTASTSCMIGRLALTVTPRQ